MATLVSVEPAAVVWRSSPPPLPVLVLLELEGPRRDVERGGADAEEAASVGLGDVARDLAAGDGHGGPRSSGVDAAADTCRSP